MNNDTKKELAKPESQPQKLDTGNKLKEPAKTKNTQLIIGFGIGLLILIILVILAFVIWPKSSNKTETAQTNSNTQTQNPASQTTTTKLIIGNPNANVSIIEYGDFKCPLCGRFFRETEPQIKKEYIDTGKANIEFRPLPIIAKDSTVAALGAYCSAEQSKFEAYHNATFKYIYDNYYSKSLKDEFSNIFTLETLTKIAGEQGLDTQAFNTCMTSNKYSSAIEASEAQAKTDGASATPTIIIGGKKISGAQPFAVYKPFIEAQLR